MRSDLSKDEVRVAVGASVMAFCRWLTKNGYHSYDQFDFWGSSFGVWSKWLFEKNKLAAAPFVLSLQIMESFFPGLRGLFAEKRRFAIGDAHLALGFMNLHLYYGSDAFLNLAESNLNHIKSTATMTDSGIGWGYPYIWVTPAKTFDRGTPFITVTPYCFDAFLKAYDITGNKAYLLSVKKAAEFAAWDLNEVRMPDGAIASSYSNVDKDIVNNANGYRAAMLLKAFELFGTQEYEDKALNSLDYVLSQQCVDGSWFYARDSLFIDNFHTCFVLKNLYKAYQITQDKKILESVKRGYDYYTNNMFRHDGSPIHFTKVRYPKFRKIEMYDYAEAISLCVLLKDEIESAFEFSLKLSMDLIEKFQQKNGAFVTRVTSLNTKNSVPYLRWPQAQIFYALTNVLTALKNQ